MVNKINRYKGGNREDLLNNDFIIQRLKDVMNQRPLTYKFNVSIQKKRQTKIYLLHIENHDIQNEPCLEIGFFKEDKGISIVVYSLNKCAPIKNYGNFILSCLKEFADTYGYYSVIILSDASTLDLHFRDTDEDKLVYIDLAYLNILSKGESWYNRMGFYNEKNKEEILINKSFIDQEFSSLDDMTRIIEYIDNSLKIYRNKQHLTPICLKMINSYGKFREIYYFILDITKNTGDDKIHDVFSSLNNYIKHTCDTNIGTCIVDYITIQKISCFIDFVFEFLDLQYKNNNLTYISKNYKAGKKMIKTKKGPLKKVITRKNKKYI
jgi:hypothetical protein